MSTGLTTVIIAVVVFACAVALCIRYIPSLQGTADGKIGNWLVRSLVAAAFTYAAMQIYEVLRITDVVGGIAGGSIQQIGDILPSTIADILLHSGVLLGLAGVVFFLGPPADSRE